MDPMGRGLVPMSQRTSEGVARILRTEIFAGRLKPGEPLPERLLAEQLGVSRTPVREALFTLQSEGLVELTPNRGAAVRTLTAHDVEQIYSLRAVLESHAAREAATGLTEGHLFALEDAHAHLERIGSRGSAADQALADLSFHMLVSEATGSRLLHSIMGQVLAFTVSYRSNYAYPADRAAVVNQQHRAILDALRDRNPDRAEKLMRDHVESSSRFALEHFSGSGPDAPAGGDAAALA
jgi:DNA-binding GntR family transcriptional regulator